MLIKAVTGRGLRGSGGYYAPKGISTSSCLIVNCEGKFWLSVSQVWPKVKFSIKQFKLCFLKLKLTEELVESRTVS